MFLTIAIIALVLILVIIFGIFIAIFNRFQRLENGAEAGLSQIKVVLIVKNHIPGSKTNIDHVYLLEKAVVPGQLKLICAGVIEIDEKMSTFIISNGINLIQDN